MSVKVNREAAPIKRDASCPAYKGSSSIPNPSPRRNQPGYEDRVKARKMQGGPCGSNVGRQVHRGPGHPVGDRVLFREQMVAKTIGIWVTLK